MINFKFALIFLSSVTTLVLRRLKTDNLFFLFWFVEKGTALVFRKDVNVESRGDTLHHVLFIYSSYKTWHIMSTLRHSTYNKFRYSSF